ncbi:MAG: hypothetical protein V3T23_09790 [Nitrososphaerales archaeon]
MFKYILVTLLAAISYFVFYYDGAVTNELIGQLFVLGILGCLFIFMIFKFGLHYKINALNRFALSFYFSVFEYKKAQKKPSGLSYANSVREQGDVALAVNFDPRLSTAALKIPASLYSGKDPFLVKLRAKIHEAERMKLEARQLDGKATVMLEKTKDLLVEKDLVDKPHSKPLAEAFDLENGVAHIVDVTVDELKEQSYGDTPDYDIITRIAFDNSPYFSTTFKYFDSEDVLAILYRSPFMIILLGIIGTFAGFYLALGQGGDIKSGAAVAIISSLVGLPVSLLMDYINTLFPDKSRYQQAFNKYKESLEILFNHERDLDCIGGDRRKPPMQPRVAESAYE